MRFEANGPWLLLLCVLVTATSAAQPKAQTQEGLADGQRASRADASSHESLSQSLLLNPSDGLSVIGAALESRGRGRSKPDCSHLVHTVYGRAGFPYSYVSSSDLYAGVDEFERVTRPQPGDLVVWPGHVGIVVNPSQNTFFSSLRSGVGVESYSASYWKARGVPRFRDKIIRQPESCWHRASARASHQFSTAQARGSYPGSPTDTKHEPRSAT